jgi:lipoteichoic acid synthase
VDTQPLLSKYKERMELFPDFFSSFADSINARFATLSGLYPVRDCATFTLNRVNVKSLFEILHEAGYQCSLFDSCFLDYNGFRDFLQGRGIDTMYDADTMPGRQPGQSVAWGLRESETIRAIHAQIQQYATNHETFFLSYFPVAPHNPFDGVPTPFRKFHRQVLNDYTPSYLNELLYLDSCITSILDQLKDSGLLDNTLVIITDDHGEMLGENNSPVGHGWMATPELTNIPLIIMDPANPGYRLNKTIGSQIDLLPTILDLLGITLPEDQLYQGKSLYADDVQTGRNIYLNSFQQYGIIEGSRYIVGTRETASTSSANDSSLKIYGITNIDARTTFPEIQSINVSSPSISEFDKFQENFLKNYSTYCQMIRN